MYITVVRIIVNKESLVCDLYGFKDGDMLSIEPIGVGELRLRKKV